MDSSVFRGTKIILIKKFENLNKVGKVYEVGDVSNSMVIIREVDSKAAVGAVTFEDFDNHFEVVKSNNKFTKWKTFADGFGNVIGVYRTNQKKVQVKLFTGNTFVVRAESSCHKGDTFNLFFGLKLAYLRALKKLNEMALHINNTEHQRHQKLLRETKRSINNMLAEAERVDKTTDVEIKKED